MIKYDVIGSISESYIPLQAPQPSCDQTVCMSLQTVMIQLVISVASWYENHLRTCSISLMDYVRPRLLLGRKIWCSSGENKFSKSSALKSPIFPEALNWRQSTVSVSSPGSYWLKFHVAPSSLYRQQHQHQTNQRLECFWSFVFGTVFFYGETESRAISPLDPHTANLQSTRVFASTLHAVTAPLQLSSHCGRIHWLQAFSPQPLN